MKYQGDLVLTEIPEEARTGHQVYSTPTGKPVVVIDIGLWEDICFAAPSLVGLAPNKANQKAAFRASRTRRTRPTSAAYRTWKKRP